MRKLRINQNEKGFTLIELMIVIAIIGILAAIAIPNFISYRDKAFCSAAESDANAIAGILADYFSIPGNTVAPDFAAANTYTLGGTTHNLTNTNTVALVENGGTYTITVLEASGRCPLPYRTGAGWANGEGWQTATAAGVASYFMKTL